MRLGMGLGLATTRGRSTLSLVLAGIVVELIARRWADASAWDDSSTWSDFA